jgi:hypothetical protein
MTQHTPGPWNIGPHQRIISCGWSIRIPYDDSAIAYVLGEKNPEMQSNARLIAAAPDLLKALQRLTHPAADDTDLQNALQLIESLKP